MKSVMLSIKPKYCELIANDKKTVEVRKTRPKAKPPFKCYIYCTKAKNIYDLLWTETEGVGVINRHANEKVIGEFICDDIIPLHDTGEAFVAITDYDITACCLNYDELTAYANGQHLYGWRISDLVIYDKAKKLEDFGMKRPPQSWCYVEELGGKE